MKKELQKIKIAEACGWRKSHRGTGKWIHFLNEADKHFNSAWVSESQLPDYPNDLNAMHEAEKTLTNDQAVRMREIAWDLASFSKGKRNHASRDEQGRSYYNATAAERAEVFLKALELWEDA